MLAQIAKRAGVRVFCTGFSGGLEGVQPATGGEPMVMAGGMIVLTGLFPDEQVVICTGSMLGVKILFAGISVR